MSQKVLIETNQGIKEATAPVIISASRSTDVPAFYPEWFFNRLEEGWLTWVNPFNGKPLHVSFQNTRVIVFWTKNPEPVLPYLQQLDARGIGYYFTCTLNDYEQEHFEPGLPALDQRIASFITLSKRIGKEKVVWRFDPLIITDQLKPEDLLERIKRVGDQLAPYTEKLVFSFAEIDKYKKVKNNLKKQDVDWQAWTTDAMQTIAEGLQDLNKKWGITLAACAEAMDFSAWGIERNKCVDDQLMIRLFSDDPLLMDFLDGGRKKSLKDKGQRPLCGCIISKDIGQYHTCPHQCIYCYANISPETAQKNYLKYLESNKMQEKIII